MFFWTEQITRKLDTKSSLRLSKALAGSIRHKNHVINQLNPNSENSRNQHSSFNQIRINPHKIPVYKVLFWTRKTFPSTPSFVQASMTVEATFAFSFFLFFLVNVFSLLLLFFQYSEGVEKIQQQGKQLAMYAYHLETTGKEDLIRLRTMVRSKAPFSLLSAPEAAMEVKCVIKPWTGYDVEQVNQRKEEEETVFMTDHGEVYHRSRTCTHLLLTIRTTAFSSIGQQRNQAGGRYYPCEHCEKGSFGTAVYITEQGDRYHASLGCRGLKRTVSAVYLSELSGVEACSKCGR